MLERKGEKGTERYKVGSTSFSFASFHCFRLPLAILREYEGARRREEQGRTGTTP